MVKILVIDNQAQIALSLDALVKLEPKFSKVRELVGTPKLRNRTDGFLALFKIIVSQQLSTASADAIWTRLQTHGVSSPSELLRKDDAHLRSLGLSQTKISYCKGLAESRIDYSTLAKCSDTEILTILTNIRGIGEWTAQIYCMFCLGRADLFACGDLALQEAIRDLYKLPQRPSIKETALISKEWSPYRTVAALILWNYYNKIRNRQEGRKR